MIKIDIRSKRFGDSVILGPISIEVAKGEVLALVGPSGIGKSTLLRIAMGVDTEFDGTISRPSRQAVVFQEPTLLPWRNTLDNLRIVHSGLAVREAQDMLAQVGLDGKEMLFPRQLSLGQQRRLALARAFAMSPEMMIMDEPFVSLDAETASMMLTLTKDLIAIHRPATLLVTHSMAESDLLAQKTLRLIDSPDGAVLSN